MNEPETLIDALRARGAERFDPVGFRFIEALADRAAAQPEPARRRLDRRLAQALAEFRERWERAEREARDALERATAQFPEAAEGLRERYEAGDFAGLRQKIARLQGQGDSRPLAELLARLGRQPSHGAPKAPAHATEPPGELKSAQVFRRTWSRLRVDRQLADAFSQAPENAGPLNSHSLVLRALRLMRDVSPEYLEQFSAYAEALLWLEQTAHADKREKQRLRSP